MRQELKSEHSRQVIVDQAFKLFYKQGFKMTSIDMIMRSTNLTKGAFYHHYRNKKELGLEVIAMRVRQRVYESMILPLFDSGDTLMILETIFLERLKSFSFYEKQHGCPLNNLINEIGNWETVYQKALKGVVEEWKSALVSLLERGKRENRIKDGISSKAMAVYLICGFEGIRGIRKLYEDDVILEEYLSGLAVFFDQLRA